MRIWLPKNRKELKQNFSFEKKPLLKKHVGWKMKITVLRKYLHDPFYKNAYFLMLSSGTSAGSGSNFRKVCSTT